MAKQKPTPSTRGAGLAMNRLGKARGGCVPDDVVLNAGRHFHWTLAPSLSLPLGGLDMQTKKEPRDEEDEGEKGQPLHSMNLTCVPRTA